MGVIPWGFESPLRHQVGRRGNGAHAERGEGEDTHAVRVCPVSTPLGAARRASEVRQEPHGDPGAGGVGVGEPDSQPLLARESKLPRALSARFGKFRFLVFFF